MKFKKLRLSKNKWALVDVEDFERLRQFNWICTTNTSKKNISVGKLFTVYAFRWTPRKQYKRCRIYLHQEIIGSKYIDHINGNGLDNRKKNLRKCSRSQNQANRRSKYTSTLKLKGVFRIKYKTKNPYRANLQHKGVMYYLGVYPTAKQASEAYMQKAKEIHKEFARKK